MKPSKRHGARITQLIKYKEKREKERTREYHLVNPLNRKPTPPKRCSKCDRALRINNESGLCNYHYTEPKKVRCKCGNFKSKRAKECKKCFMGKSNIMKGGKRDK